MKALIIILGVSFMASLGKTEIIPIPKIYCDDKVELEFDGESFRFVKIMGHGYSFRETVDKDNSGNDLVLLPKENQELTKEFVLKLTSPASDPSKWRIDIQTGTFDPTKTLLNFNRREIPVTCQFSYEKREI